MVRRACIYCLYGGLRFCDVKALTYKNVDHSNKLLNFKIRNDILKVEKSPTDDTKLLLTINRQPIGEDSKNNLANCGIVYEYRPKNRKKVEN